MSSSPRGTSPDVAVQTDHRKARWVVLIAAVALVFDGYDLVVYGTVVPTLLRDPSQIGALSPASAGALGSYTMIGVLVGALTAGAVGDHIGRRRVMLVNIGWFSVGMALTAMTSSIATFGLFRFLTGVGVGALVATAGALVAEFAPPGRRNLYNAVVYSGVPAGGVLAALVAMLASDAVGWRGLFWVGALPAVTLLPLALAKLPESPHWLAARSVVRTLAPGAARPKVGFAALATRRYALATALLGTMSFAGLLLTYGLNTWLPEIMGQNGYGKSYSLMFLLILNLGAILGGILASRSADRLGPQRVVSTTFTLAAVALVLLPLSLPFPVLALGVAIAGVGTIGTQVLIYGFVSNYYETVARAAGVAWCAGFGRLGGIVGPVVGGLLLGAGLGGGSAFRIFAAVALAGAVVTLFVPRRRTAADLDVVTAPVEPREPAVAGSTVTG